MTAAINRGKDRDIGAGETAGKRIYSPMANLLNTPPHGAGGGTRPGAAIRG
jgi:hypothetical protein